MGNQLSRFDLIGGNLQQSDGGGRIIGMDRKLILHYLRVFLYNTVDRRRHCNDSNDSIFTDQVSRVPSIHSLRTSSTLDLKLENELLEAVEFFYGPFGRVHDALKECQERPLMRSSSAIKPAPSFAADLVELQEIVPLLPLSLLERNDLVDWTSAVEAMSAQECNLVTAAVARMTRPERLFIVIDQIMASALHQHNYIDPQVLLDVQKLIALLFPILSVIVHSTNDKAPSTLASANELLAQYESLYLIMYDLEIPAQALSSKGFDRVDEECDLPVNASISLTLMLLADSSRLPPWKGALLGESLLRMLATLSTSNADLVQPLVSLLTARCLMMTNETDGFSSEETIDKICRLLNVFLLSKSTALAEALLEDYDPHRPFIFLLTSCSELNQNPELVRRVLPRLLVTGSCGAEDLDSINLSVLLRIIRADISLDLFDEAYLLIVSNGEKLVADDIRRELVAELVQRMLTKSSSKDIRQCLDGVAWKEQDWNVLDQVLSTRMFASGDERPLVDRSSVMDLFQWHLDRKNISQACVLLYSAAMQTSMDSSHQFSGENNQLELQQDRMQYLLVLENFMLATERDMVFEYRAEPINLAIVRQKLALMQAHLALEDVCMDKSVSELVVMLLTRPKPKTMLALHLLEQFTGADLDAEEMLYGLGWDSMLAFLVDKCTDPLKVSVDEPWIAEFLISKWASVSSSTDASISERVLLSIFATVPLLCHPLVFEFVVHRFLEHADVHHQQLVLPVDLLVLFAECDCGNSLVRFVCQMYLSSLTPHVPCVCNQLFAMLPVALSKCPCQLTEESVGLLQKAIASDQPACFHHQF